MKKTLLFLVLTFFVVNVSGQQSLETGPDGKLRYYEIVSFSAKQDSVLRRAKAFFRLSAGSRKETGFIISGKFIIDKTFLVASHPSGEVTWELTFEVKDDKYRFWLTDFIFTPYDRDRYGNFVAGNNRSTPLERRPGKLNTASWKANNDAIYLKAAKLGEELKAAISGVVVEREKW